MSDALNVPFNFFNLFRQVYIFGHGRALLTTATRGALLTLKAPFAVLDGLLLRRADALVDVSPTVGAPLEKLFSPRAGRWQCRAFLFLML